MSKTDDSLEAIAVIGLSGRFPGASSVHQFWHNLRGGIESIHRFTDKELESLGIPPDVYNHPDYIKAGTVLENVDMFDAEFFRFSPREAEIRDPQHRIFLECAWEALENAGYDVESYRGQIGVFAGCSPNYYGGKTSFDFDPALVAEAYSREIGNEKDYLCTLVSYKLGLKGPAVTIQTACSTSLVAVCLACQGLMTYQCDMVLAGGVCVNTRQKGGYFYQEGFIPSPDGHCRAFDAKAQGTVLGQGAGVVLLKRLSEALIDGDTVYAVIKGFAINNDGSEKVGYTAPGVNGQAEVIAMAQALSGMSPESISYIEAHGTGTPLGDPIEIAALNKAFREGTEKKAFCGIGSLKTNIGHLDAAAGVAGLIKTVLMLKNREIPPSLHFEEPNTDIDFADSPFYVNTKLKKWVVDGLPLRAGVSSFGIGGTNAHVVLEEAPEIEPSSPSRPRHLLLLSAKTESALDAANKNLCEYLTVNPDTNITDVAYTLQTGRKAFNYRRYTVCDDASDAVQALKAIDPQRVKTRHIESRDPEVVFMFPGQGTQYVNMGLNLYEHEPLFRQMVDQCAEILEPFLNRDLRELLYPKVSDLEAAEALLRKTGFQQPAIFTIEYALAILWEKWGVRTAAMIGHSIGEYVAACLAEVFSLEDALMLVATRGRMMQELPGGAMLSVRLPATEVEPKLNDQLSLAALNAPSLCVVSGPTEAVQFLQEELKRESVMCRFLHTSHAFHSPMMDAIVEPFTERVHSVQLSAPKIPFVSTATGTWITADQATDPMYWGRQLRATVRFAEGIKTLWERPECVLLEVGPRTTCSTLARQQAKDISKQAVIPSLGDTADDDAEWTAILGAMGQLWISGAQIDWENFYARENRHRVGLPTYPFERKRFWIEPAGVGALRDVKERPAQPHDMDHIIQQDGQQFIPGSSSEDEYDAPNTEAEVLLASIWQEVLGVERIGVDDNFSYDLGGDSLSVIQVIEIVRKKTGVHLDPKIFLLTLRQIAPYLQVEPSLAETRSPAFQIDSKYYVAEVTNQEDLDQAISILKRNLESRSWKEKHTWFYEKNPYRKGKLWLLKLKDSEKAVAVGGVGYRLFNIRGRSLVGAIGVDLAVEKEYRTLDPVLKLQHTIMESAKKEADFIYGFPSKQAMAVSKHFGYQKIGEFTRLIKILRSREYLEMFVKNRMLSIILSIPLDFFLRFRLVRSLFASKNYCFFDNIKDISDICDNLWEQLSTEDLLIGERSSSYFDWRYFKCPNANYKIFGLKDDHKPINGFIVYYRDGKKIDIVDFVYPKECGVGIIKLLLKSFERYCLSTGVNLIGINLIGAKEIHNLLRSNGYWYNKKQQQPLTIFTDKNQHLLDLFKDLDSSYWFWGDLH